jgi:histidinol dehydrogenase
VPEGFDQILLSTSQSPDLMKLQRLREKISFAGLLKGKGVQPYSKIREQVIQIVNAVQIRGDGALAEFTENYDNVKLTSKQFRITASDLQKAHEEIDKDLLASLRAAIANVKKYQEEIFIGNFRHPGIKYVPIEKVGICVPGASAPLPSTVIMSAVPALVAKVKPENIAVVSPPRYKGSIHPDILAVCYELGITQVYRIGGAQAVAALAWGTDTIAKVDKIVGPGNQWVQTAKREVFGLVDIDSIAGASEVLIIANDKANPAWVAADMLSQAEHASDSSAIVVTDSEDSAKKILGELKKQVKQLARADDAIQSLKEYSAVVVTKDMSEAIGLANDFAAEHLEIQCGEQSRAIAEQIENAGAIFIGDYTPVAVGDYWAGPSHTLPTGTSAKFFSALTSNDFVKSISIIEFDKQQLADAADDIIRLAKTEGLDAHAKSVDIRRQQ